MSIHPRLFLYLKNWVFLPLVVLCLPALAVLGKEVYRDLKLLRAAEADTVQWTLSQVEIDYLNFLVSLERGIDPRTSDLGAVRKNFDILYSRNGILVNGGLFASTREIDGFLSATTTLQSFLDNATEVIDGPDIDLQTAIPVLREQADVLHPQVRSIFVQALTHFAHQSDQQRLRVSGTLTELVIVSVITLIALAALSLYSMYTKALAQKSARALARANVHMQTILSTTREAVIVADTRGRILDLNAAAETTFGYSLAEAKYQKIGDLIVPPEQKTAHAEGFARLVKTGESRLVGKGRVRLEALKANDSRIPVELAMQSAKTEDGEVIIGFLRDISDQIEIEAELVRARDMALAGEKAKADFLAVMSHEIRTPLNGLLGNLTLASKTKMDADQAVFIQNMEISGRQLMHHVNSILDIAKFEAGKTSVTHASFHLGRFLQDIVDSQSGHAGKNQTTIEWEWLGPKLDWVKADQTILEQILLNLIGNAIKFTHGGRISIEAEQILPPEGDCNVEFRIIDSGIGISEEDQIRIFKDFETCDSSYTRDSGGTGLGLGIVQRMAQLLGGHVGVESSLGEGSVFWLRLPFVLIAEPLEVSGDERVKPAEKSLEILVAEDVETNAFVARKLLERDGHKVTIVQDGLSAVARAKAETFDVILMDISMPGMDGLQATKEIRKAPVPFCDVPILAFSANVLPEETDHFRASGMDGFIGKPLQLAELRRALQAVLDNTLTARFEQAGDAVDENAEKAQDILNKGEYDIYLTRFIDEGAAFVEELTADPLARLDLTDIVSKAHQIRSTASLFGADEFATCLGNLELAAKQANALDCQIEIAKLSEVWVKTRIALDPNPETAPVAE